LFFSKKEEGTDAICCQIPKEFETNVSVPEFYAQKFVENYLLRIKL